MRVSRSTRRANSRLPKSHKPSRRPAPGPRTPGRSRRPRRSSRRAQVLPSGAACRQLFSRSTGGGKERCGQDADANRPYGRRSSLGGSRSRGRVSRVGHQSAQHRQRRSEQSGFANLVRGTFGMFRNPTAHDARIHWTMSKEDAEDLLTIVSLIHRRLDKAHMPPRV
ncbi:putative conserved protein [Rhizobium favelukesii]|uniref:Conserved protein n=1 Tax=Rhizobium favelukesii TaxID=348824 RepID=W6RTE6_9HYPH|nr:putative conserved protein [Rhizobium favelukesii]